MSTYIITRIAAVLGLVLVVWVAPASAQEREVAKVYIPFDFRIKETKHSAGEYRISQADSGTANRTIIIRDGENKTIAMLRLLPLSAGSKRDADRPMLVFSRYGTSYVLSEVRVPPVDLTGRLGTTKLEKRLAEQFGPPKREIVQAN